MWPFRVCPIAINALLYGLCVSLYFAHSHEPSSSGYMGYRLGGTVEPLLSGGPVPIQRKGHVGGHFRPIVGYTEYQT